VTAPVQTNSSVGANDVGVVTAEEIPPARATAPTRTLDRIAHLAALATGARIAQINLVTDDKRIPVAVHFDPTRMTSADVATGSALRNVLNRDVSRGVRGARR
jgi:hypothetical protein